MSAATVYWVATGLLSALYLLSATMYVTRVAWVRDTLGQLGYPAYLRPFMAVSKVAGIVAILWRFDVAISDLAYAGIFYHLVLSGMAHFGVRKPAGAVPALIGLALLATSFATQNAARHDLSPYAPAFAAR